MPEIENKPQYYVGVDLGGTKILAGVFDQKLECIGKIKMSTKAQRSPIEVVERISRCIQDAVDECDLSWKQIRAIGIGAPGAIDPEEGKVIFAPNLAWEDLPLRKMLQKTLGVPVFVENDCNVCTLGVYELELPTKPQHMIGIFIGTGIGAGLFLNGKFFSGYNRTAGEIGHMVIDVNGPKCGCGNRGCFEAFASRTALFHRIRTAVKEGQKTLLTDMLGPDLSDMRSGDLRKAVRRGDKFVAELLAEAARYVGIAVGNMINLLNPEIIVLGGGVMDQLEGEFMPIIEDTAFDIAMPGTTKGVKILASKLGDDAGITGAAVLARRQSQ